MKDMYFSPDVLAFLALLYKYQVHYMIVGGEAVIYYGHARLTGAIDIYYENSPENVDKLFQALLEYWEGDIPGIQNKDELLTEGQIVQFGVPPNRIDLLNYIDGITFTNAWQNKITEQLRAGQDAILIYYIGLRDLILNKKKTGRPKDLEDLKYLTRLEQ